MNKILRLIEKRKRGGSPFFYGLVTVGGLAKVAIFTVNVDAENQCLINHKCICGALNRHFCQTAVTSCPSFCPKLCPSMFAVNCCTVWVRWLALSFAFFALVCVVAKKQM